MGKPGSELSSSNGETTTTTTTRAKMEMRGLVYPGGPLLREPPAVRRRRKRGTHVLDVFTEERRHRQTERGGWDDRATDLPPPCPPPFPHPEKEDCVNAIPQH